MRYYKPKNEIVDFSIILDAICEFYKITDKLHVFKDTRRHDVLRPRQWLHYFCRTLNPEFIITLQYIGEFYSDVTGRIFDHATVLHSNKTIKGFIESYKDWELAKKDILFLINLRINKTYKKPLTGKCAEQPFKITKYYDTKEPTPTSIMVSH